MTIKQAILNHLKQGFSITALGAVKKFNTTRLSAYIYLLKKDGYEFEKKRIKNGKKFYDKYKLAKQEK